MLPAPSSSAKKGEVVLQPAFFTSSLFVQPLRDDISALALAFADAWARSTEQSRPFALFKDIWNGFGWPWLHLKTLEDRSRDRFLQVVMRLFLERTIEFEQQIVRVTALFGLYIFYETQPTSRAPRLHLRTHVPIPLDIYTSLLRLPSALDEPALAPMRPHVTHVLRRLLDSRMFLLLPPSTQHPENPRELPREVYVNEALGVLAGLAPVAGVAPSASDTSQNAAAAVEPARRKVGRPSKRDKARRARETLDRLDKWLAGTGFTYPPGEGPPGTGAGLGVVTNEDHAGSTEALVLHPPLESSNAYRAHKLALLDELAPTGTSAGAASSGVAAIADANARVLARLRRIDTLAAEKGLEVGAAGGAQTGLARVERAVAELGQSGAPGRRAGALSLLEGAGLSHPTAN